MSPRRPTSTSNFGVGRREAHDASGFYARFSPPLLSDDETVLTPEPVSESLVRGDARCMTAVKDGSVALVVTSPPYFAGKQYEEELGKDGVPGTYLEYLTMLEDVFAECVRKLEPGGRIAINVANLGRKPYRSLSADVIDILQNRLGLLMRGEILWRKGEGATGSCAWGSFRSPTNPVLRDLTERVIVASKGRFSRALSAKERHKRGLPAESDLGAEDFMEYTLDVWTLPPEQARRVNHPAPFPVELPARLIALHTFRDDLVLDPFVGSGSTMVAAKELHRRFIGYDLDPDYLAIASTRLAETEPIVDLSPRVGIEALAEQALTESGFAVIKRDIRVRGTGLEVAFVARGPDGTEWLVDVAGRNLTYRGGLARTDEVLKLLGRAAAIGASDKRPLLVFTSELPKAGSKADLALRSGAPSLIVDVIVVPETGTRLNVHATGPPRVPS